jgi:hypothetical protein
VRAFLLLVHIWQLQRGASGPIPPQAIVHLNHLDHEQHRAKVPADRKDKVGLGQLYNAHAHTCNQS